MSSRRALLKLGVSVCGMTAIAGCSSSESDGSEQEQQDGSEQEQEESTTDPASQLRVFGGVSSDNMAEGILAADIGIENPTEQSVTAEFTALMSLGDDRGEITSETVEETIPSKEAPNISPVFFDGVSSNWSEWTGVAFYGCTLKTLVNNEPHNLSCYDSLEGEGYESTDNGCEFKPIYSTHIEVEYSGNWQGSMGSAGSTKSVSRSSSTFGAPQGEDTSYVPISEDATIVSGNAQKQEDNTEELTIRIVDGGEVVAEESTSASYGLAQISTNL